MADLHAPARTLHQHDPSAATLGIELVEASPHGAVVTMVVRPDMCNGYAIVHGGMVFLLADSAMAFASVSAGEPALATTAEIDWVAPARAGQRLTATAERRWAGGRTCMWDVTVTADEQVVGLFRGRTRTVSREVADVVTNPSQADIADGG